MNTSNVFAFPASALVSQPVSDIVGALVSLIQSANKRRDVKAYAQTIDSLFRSLEEGKLEQIFNVMLKSDHAEVRQEGIAFLNRLYAKEELLMEKAFDTATSMLTGRRI